MHVVLSKTGTEDGMPRVDLYRADITLVGSNRSARLEPGVRSEGWSRYILQGDSADGRIADRYRKLVYRDVYPGIDQHLSVNDQGPKVDYIVHPGARPETIRLTYTGVTGLHVQEDGSLWMNTPICGIREAKPIAWTQQSDGSGRTPVEVSYVVDGTSVQFSVGTYDRSKTLVIDPQRMGNLLCWQRQLQQPDGGHRSHRQRLYCCVDRCAKPTSIGRGLSACTKSSTRGLHCQVQLGRTVCVEYVPRQFRCRLHLRSRARSEQ